MTLILNGTDSSATTPAVTGTDTDTGIYYPTSNQVAISTAGTQALLVDASQNVGVGTTSPSQKLTLGTGFVQTGNGVGGAGGVWFPYSGDASGRTWRARTDLVGYGDWGLEQSTTQTGTTFVTKFLIDSTGDVIIGGTTVSAGAKLNVYQADSSQRVVHFENTRNVSGDENLRLLLGSNCNNTSSYSFISSTGGADKLYIYGNGNVVNVNNSYGSLSDVKLKENIVDATPKLADLMQVKVRNYNLIGNTTKQIGVVAQELETIFPGMIDISPDRDTEGNNLGTTTKSVKYSVFVPMLVKAIQELKAEFDAYKASHP